MNLVTSFQMFQKQKRIDIVSIKTKKNVLWKDEHRDWIKMTVSSWIIVFNVDTTSVTRRNSGCRDRALVWTQKEKMDWLSTNHHFVFTTPALSSISVERDVLLVKDQHLSDTWLPKEWWRYLCSCHVVLREGGTHFSTSEMLTANGSQLGWSLGTVLNRRGTLLKFAPTTGALKPKTSWWKSIKASPPPMDISEGPFQAQISLRHQLEASVKLHQAHLLPLPNPVSLYPVLFADSKSVPNKTAHNLHLRVCFPGNRPWPKEVTDAYFHL